jgi:hypothetical protein
MSADLIEEMCVIRRVKANYPTTILYLWESWRLGAITAEEFGKVCSDLEASERKCLGESAQKQKESV